MSPNCKKLANEQLTVTCW